MPDANDVFGPFDGALWAQSQWFRDAPAWAPSAVLGTPATSAGAGALGATFSGLNGTIGLGRAHIRGAGYERIGSGKVIAVPANTHASSARRDRFVLRRDLAAKTVEPVLLQGTPSSAPTPPALTRVEDGVWDLALHSFLVPPNSGSNVTGIIDERVWWDPAGSGPLAVFTTAARDAAVLHPGLEVWRADLGVYQAYTGATWAQRASQSSVSDWSEKSRFLVNTASGTLGSGVTVNLSAEQTIAGAPFGSNVDWQLTMDARVYLTDIPSGIGARLELLIDDVVFGGDEFTNAGSTSCRHTLKVRDIAYVQDNNPRRVRARLTALSGTVTVSTEFGRVFLEATPRQAL